MKTPSVPQQIRRIAFVLSLLAFVVLAILDAMPAYADTGDTGGGRSLALTSSKSTPIRRGPSNQYSASRPSRIIRHTVERSTLKNWAASVMGH